MEQDSTFATVSLVRDSAMDSQTSDQPCFMQIVTRFHADNINNRSGCFWLQHMRPWQRCQHSLIEIRPGPKDRVSRPLCCHGCKDTLTSHPTNKTSLSRPGVKTALTVNNTQPGTRAHQHDELAIFTHGGSRVLVQRTSETQCCPKFKSAL